MDVADITDIVVANFGGVDMTLEIKVSVEGYPEVLSRGWRVWRVAKDLQKKFWVEFGPMTLISNKHKFCFAGFNFSLLVNIQSWTDTRLSWRVFREESQVDVLKDV